MQPLTFETVHDLQQLSDKKLHESAVKTSEQERRITLELLKHLNEIERRHLFSKFSCSSLHGYCVRELKFSDDQASRRVAAARLLRELPKTEGKLLSGDLSLTSAAQAKTFFHQEARFGHRFEPEVKAQIIESLEAKSTRDAMKILISNSAKPEIHFKETVRPKTEHLTEVRLHFDQETMVALERLKEIWSHALPIANLADIIKRAALEVVDRHDPIKKAERASARTAQSSLDTHAVADQTKGGISTDASLTHQSGVAAVTNLNPSSDLRTRPYHSAWIRHEVMLRDLGQCTFTDPRTGERCRSQKFLQFDHIIPVAHGGETSVENLRLRCQAHNMRHAIEDFGLHKMARHAGWGE